MEGPVLAIVQSVITSLVGIYALSAAIEGYLRGKLNILFRILLAGAALLLIDAGTVTDIIGAGTFMAVYLLRRSLSNK